VTATFKMQRTLHSKDSFVNEIFR